MSNLVELVARLYLSDKEKEELIESADAIKHTSDMKTEKLLHK